MESLYALTRTHWKHEQIEDEEDPEEERETRRTQRKDGNARRSPYPAFGHPLPIGWGKGIILLHSEPGAAVLADTSLAGLIYFVPSGLLSLARFARIKEIGQWEPIYGWT